MIHDTGMDCKSVFSGRRRPPETSPEPAPGPLPLAHEFADVLRGTASFILREDEPPISLADVPATVDPYDSYMSPLRYAVADLSGDETPESSESYKFAIYRACYDEVRETWISRTLRILI